VSDADIEIIDCSECGQPIETRWARDGNHGLLPSDDYLLIADWVFHPDCWDAVVKRGEPPDEERPRD
jgi:hypothetical protein